LAGNALPGESGFFAVELVTEFLVSAGESAVFEDATDAPELGVVIAVLVGEWMSDSGLQGNRGSGIGDGHLWDTGQILRRKLGTQ
jgi:hypothetical protein